MLFAFPHLVYHLFNYLLHIFKFCIGGKNNSSQLQKQAISASFQYYPGQIKEYY